jgi:hypothetical protein
LITEGNGLFLTGDREITSCNWYRFQIWAAIPPFGEGRALWILQLCFQGGAHQLDASWQALGVFSKGGNLPAKALDVVDVVGSLAVGVPVGVGLGLGLEIGLGLSWLGFRYRYVERSRTRRSVVTVASQFTLDFYV